MHLVQLNVSAIHSSAFPFPHIFIPLFLLSCADIWSPDGRFFMTTTTRPRLQVDNGFRIFRYTGEGPIIHEKHDVLYDVVWRPAPSGTFPARPASPEALEKAKKSTESSSEGSKPRAVYRAPGSTGVVSQLMTKARLGGGASESSGTTGMRTNAPVGMPNTPPGMPPPSNQGQKKKSGKKNKKKETDQTNQSDPSSSTGENAEKAGPDRSEKAVEEMTLDELRKERRKLAKKFKQIDNLKQLEAEGKELASGEKAKVNSEKDMSAKLDTIVARMKDLSPDEDSSK